MTTTKMLNDPARNATYRAARPLRLFLICTAGFFLTLLLLNAPHLGGNIAIHWDTLNALQMGWPAVPDQAALADHRKHLYDVCQVAHSDDPAIVTQFWTPGTAKFRDDLVTLRLYYWQVGNVANQAVLFLADTLFTDPRTGIFFYQLAPMLLTAAAFGLLLAHALSRSFRMAPAGPRGTIPPMAVLLWVIPPFLAIATAPVFLSLARQLLTETLGFTFMVPGLLLLGYALHARTPLKPALWAAAGAAVVLFLAIKTRYSLGPFILLLLPLLALAENPLADLLNRKRRLALLLAVAALAAANLVAADVAHYGPYLLPGVYNDVMVKSARMFFHDPGHYTYFLSALFVDAVPIVIPLTGLASLFFLPAPRTDTASHRRILIAYTLLLVATLAYLLLRTARMEVTYQPRHLFPFLACFLCILAFLLPRLAATGRTVTCYAFSLVCFIALGLNIYSSFGPQRQILDFNPTVLVGALGDRARSPNPENILKVAISTYYDSGDNRRLHDSIETIAFLQQQKSSAPGTKPLLLVETGILLPWNYVFIARSFGGADVRLLEHPFAADDLSAVNAALAAGREVFVVSPLTECTVPKQVPTAQIPLSLDLAVLRQIKTIQ